MAASSTEAALHVAAVCGSLTARPGSPDTVMVYAKLARATPGLDVERTRRESRSATVERRLAAAQSQARQTGIDSTPSFLVGRAGGRLERLEPGSLDPEAFTARLDELLTSR